MAHQGTKVLPHFVRKAEQKTPRWLLGALARHVRAGVQPEVSDFRCVEIRHWLGDREGRGEREGGREREREIGRPTPTRSEGGEKRESVAE